MSKILGLLAVISVLVIVGFALLAASPVLDINLKFEDGFGKESVDEKQAESCSYGKGADGRCLDYKESKEVVRTYEYTLRGERGIINFILYSALNDALAKTENAYVCRESDCPNQIEVDKILTKRILDHLEQKKELRKLASKIFEEGDTEDDRARVAISLVQNIDYDYQALASASANKYPYQALYEKKGVCGEKAILLAGLLNELGYGVALLQYYPEKHMAVGLRCPDRYDYLDSGYCFVESTIPSIITDDQGDYAGAGKLRSVPQIIEITDGREFKSVYEEYQDALDWKELRSMSGQAVDKKLYDRWKELGNKYGMEIDALD
jgi:hypothetical protein